MITVGITGRSGSGKSTVTAFFKKQGVPFADADQISRELLLPHSPLLPLLAECFGADILEPETGALRRRLLADRAFQTPENTAILNSIVHPAIVRRIRTAKKQAEQDGASLFLIDGAVIIGTPCEAECDLLLVVHTPFETSVARIMARDGISQEMAVRRLNAQMTEEEILSKADILLHNTGSLEELQTAADAAYQALCHRASTTNQKEE